MGDADEGSVWRPFLVGVLAIFRSFFLGVVQSLDVLKLVRYLEASSQVRQILGSCVLVNLLFFLSIWVSSVLFSPMWGFGVRLLWKTAVLGGGLRSELNRTVVTVADSALVTEFVHGLWTCVFHVMWVIPMYGLTQALGVQWYSVLYSAACAEKRRCFPPAAMRAHRAHGPSRLAGRDNERENIARVSSSPSFSSSVVSITEILYKVVSTAVYAVTMMFVGIVFPTPLSTCIVTAMNSWLYAFYVFDYRISSQHVFDRSTKRYIRITLSSALRFFEANWAYFLGFGATRCAITGVLYSTGIATSWFAVAAVLSVLFGIHVVISVEATPAPRVPFRVPMFTPFFFLCDRLLRVIARVIQ